MENLKKILWKSLPVIITLALFQSCSNNGPDNTEKKISALLSRMTLEEKVGQMAQITLDVIGKGDSSIAVYEPFSIDTTKLFKAVCDYKIGSVLNTSNNKAMPVILWNKIVSEIQDYATNRTRLKIPVIYGIDAVRGMHYAAEATLFPNQIGLAATWNPDLVKETAAITAYETRACNIPWNFSPILDLGSDPRFPRQYEGFGEDPYLCTILGLAMIMGYQGENTDSKERVAACAKHYLGYSVPASGKDRTPAFIPENYLREYHLPSFDTAVKAGVMTFMVNSGIINGVTVHASRYLITDVLKGELGFRGFVVTDWNDIDNLYRRDKIAKDEKESIKIVINAGVDMAMIPYNYESFCKNLTELVKEGSVSQKRINDAVRRILRVKFALGLFDRPNTSVNNYPEFGSEKFAAVSYNAAAESITLLKNRDNILPLTGRERILVTGPNANSMRTLNGGWAYSWQGDKVELFAQKYNTIFEAIQNKFGALNVSFIPGISYNMNGKYFEEYKESYIEAINKAKVSDIVLLCAGENSYAEKPGDLNDLNLSDLQINFAKDLAKTGKPVILILNEGRPRCFSKIEPDMSAVIQTYLPGNFGGDALASILSGEVNPSGRLPYTYPAFPNSIVTYYHKPSEEQTPAPGAYNYESDYNPQYLFGSGLSYTTFTYSEIKTSKNVMKSADDSLTITINVTNSGRIEGKEVVMLFTSDVLATYTPDTRRLRRFSKTDLLPGETKSVKFVLKPEDLAYVTPENRRITEPGVFKLFIADKEKEITVK
jgi:beta-glucosidase